MQAAAEESHTRTPVDPYTAYELPALASRAIAHAYVATAVGMPFLLLLEWLVRRHGFADDAFADAALRCLVPAGVALVFALTSRWFPVARYCPVGQGYALVATIAVVLGLSASVTGGMASPYLVSLQTMLYLWGLIMPGGFRLAIAPAFISPAIFFTTLGLAGAPLFPDMRAVVTVVFTATSAALSLAYAEVIERRRRAVWTASSVDSLSGLFNRRYLLERFEAIAARSASRGAPLSVLLFDVDRFKRINDTHGHAAGDVVIQGVAAILLGCSRATDLSGRIGGEEFALVLDGASAETAQQVAERIRESVEAARFSAGDAELSVTVSVGISTQRAGEARTVDQLLRQADEALYESKRSGRNRVTPFAA